MKSSQDPQPLQVWALISRHFSTHIGCSTRPQYPPVFPCVCFHITFIPCLCLHLFYTAVGIHLIGHWLLGKCWLSAQQIRAPPCQICHASNPLLRHRCVVREVCDMKIYSALCCKRRPGGVTPSKPHLLQSRQSARRDHRPSISASFFFSWLALARDPPAWACHPFYPSLLQWSHHARGVKGLTSNFNGRVFTLSLAGLLHGSVNKIKRKKCHAKRGNRDWQHCLLVGDAEARGEEGFPEQGEEEKEGQEALLIQHCSMDFHFSPPTLSSQVPPPPSPRCTLGVRDSPAKWSSQFANLIYPLFLGKTYWGALDFPCHIISSKQCL